MKYFHDMCDKFGFSDGEATPADAWKHRKVYVEVVNAMAEKLGSEVRAIEFDRCGCHNGCMILFVKAKDVGRKRNVRPCEPDDQMQEAYMLAGSDLDVDGLVETRSRIQKRGLKAIIKSIKDGTAIEGLDEQTRG